MSDTILTLILRANLALTVGVLLVLALRRPIRRAFGPLAAYALWLVAPLCVVTALLPAPAATGAMAPVVALAADAAWQVRPVARQVHRVSEILTVLWIAGAVGAAILFAARQARFVRSLGRLAPSSADPTLLLGQHTGAGPLLLGAIRPRIVAPADFEARFQGAGARARLGP